MSVPRLAVLIPTFNDMPYVEECLASIWAHTRFISEVCISDNGSTDGTWEAVSRFTSSDFRVRLQRRVDTDSVFSNWSRVLTMSTSEYVMFLSSDDYLLPSGLEEVLDRMDEQPSLAGVALGMRYFDDATGEVLLYAPPADTELALNRSPARVIAWMLGHANHDELIYAVWRRRAIIRAISTTTRPSRESTAWWWSLFAMMEGTGLPRFGVSEKPVLMKRVAKSAGSRSTSPTPTLQRGGVVGAGVAARSSLEGRGGSLLNAVRLCRVGVVGWSVLPQLLFAPRTNASTSAVSGGPLSPPGRIFRRRG